MICNIKKFREKGKLTQTEVAEAVGVTVGAVSQMGERALPAKRGSTYAVV